MAWDSSRLAIRADEIDLGKGDGGEGDNRAQRDFGHTPWGAANGRAFTFDQANDKLVTAVDIGDNGSVGLTPEYPILISQVTALHTGCTVDKVDFTTLILVGRNAGTTVDFNSVMLNSYSLVLPPHLARRGTPNVPNRDAKEAKSPSIGSFRLLM